MDRESIGSACGSRRLKGFAPYLAMLLGALILVVSLLLPFGSARKSLRDALSASPDTIYDKELNMTCADAMDISLVEFARIFGSAGDIGSIFSMAAIIAVGVFALLTLLFAALKKPVPAIVFTLLAFGALLLVLKDFDLRGSFSTGSSYKLGCACWFMFVGIAAEMFGSIWMLVERAKLKKLHTVDGGNGEISDNAADESEEGK